MSELPVELTPTAIAEGEALSQRVCRSREVQNRPRPQDMGGVSLIRGEVSAETAYRVVRKARSAPSGDDGVRYTTAGVLREAGFVVEHTPNNRNPDHVRVVYPGEWDDTVALLFEACYGDVVWHDGGEEARNV